MREFSLPPKEQLGNLGFITDSLHTTGAFAAKYRYALIAIAAVLAVFAIVVVLQSSAASKQHSEAAPATVKTTVQADQSTLATEPATIQSNEASAAPEGASSNSEVKTELKVNNQTVPVPDNGSVQKTIVSDNGTSQVNISVNTSSNTSNQTHSSTSLNVNTNTQSSSETIIEDSE